MAATGGSASSSRRAAAASPASLSMARCVSRCSSASACAATRKSWFSRSAKVWMGSARPWRSCWSAAVRSSRRPEIRGQGRAVQQQRRPALAQKLRQPGSVGVVRAQFGQCIIPLRRASTADTAVTHVARSGFPLRWETSRARRRVSGLRPAVEVLQGENAVVQGEQRRSAWPGSSPSTRSARSMASSAASVVRAGCPGSATDRSGRAPSRTHRQPARLRSAPGSRSRRPRPDRRSRPAAA